MSVSIKAGGRLKDRKCDFMQTLRSQRGMTAVELIVAVIVLSFALLSLVQLYSNLGIRSADGQFRLTATLIAQELMEEIKSKRFDENFGKNVNNNWSGVLGADAAEVATNKNTFDDIDDFNGWNENLIGAYAGFNRAVVVVYVDPADLNTPLVIPGPLPPAWTPDLKRVRITVTNGGTQYAELITIIGTGRA